MFSLYGPVYRVLSFLYRCLLLNLLYIAFCIPLITVPPATAGLFSVARKLVYKDEPPLLKTFWLSFKENIVQSWIAAIVFAVVGIVTWNDYRFFLTVHTGFSTVGAVVLGIASLFVLSTLMHVFPLMVHMKLKTSTLFMYAMKLNLIKPYLTLSNLLVLCAWFLVSTHVSILIVALFFSISALATYWTVDQKFKVILVLQDRNSSPGEQP